MARYDVIVIGGGPAGYTAALYTARAGLRTVVLERLFAGGQMTQTQQIDNYPGFPQGIDGITLGMQMQEGALRFGVEAVSAEVTSVFLDQPVKAIMTSEGMYEAPAVIIATGAGHKHLGLPKEQELTGRGVAYCAACDAMFYRGKTVAVVGGGNSAAAEAAVLSRVAKKVYLIHRRDKLRADHVYHKPLADLPNLEFIFDSQVIGLSGQEKLESITLRHKDSSLRQLALDGLFISVGMSPATNLFQGQLALDENGYIWADETTRTSLPGVFAAGDVRTKAVRQIVTATADGAVAAHFAAEYLLAEA